MRIVLKIFCSACLLFYASIALSCEQNTRLLTILDEKWEVVLEPLGLLHPLQIAPVMFFDSHNGVSFVGNIRSTKDSGATWSESFDREGGFIYYGMITGRRRGLAVGEDSSEISVILATNDSGKTWKKLEYVNRNEIITLESPPTFRRLCFTEDGGAWTLANTGLFQIRITKDSWEILDFIKITTKNNSVLRDMTCGKHVFATDFEGVLYRYSNKLDVIALSGRNRVTNIFAVDDGLWILGSTSLNEGAKKKKGWLKWSGDDGQTWTDKTPKNKSELDTFIDISIKNKKGWLFGTDGTIYYTKDNGDSWNMSAKVSDYYPVSQIFFLDEENVWIAVGDGMLLKRKQPSYWRVF